MANLMLAKDLHSYKWNEIRLKCHLYVSVTVLLYLMANYFNMGAWRRIQIELNSLREMKLVILTVTDGF